MITFPGCRNFPPNEWNCHIKFYMKIFELSGHKVVIDNNIKSKVSGLFPVFINNKIVYFDHSDHPDHNWYKLNFKLGGERYNPQNINAPIFKRFMHTKFKYNDNIYPAGPLYLKNINYINNLLTMGNIYNPSNANKFIHTGLIHSGAKYTRKPIFNKIIKNEKFTFDDKIIPTLDHWKRFAKCISSLNISGANIYTLDPGQLEAMFLGVCIISNNIDSYLPYNKKLDKNLHYICIDDFTDINECLNYVYDNRQECKERGQVVHTLLHNTCTPKLITNWIIEKTGEYYE